MGKPTATMAVQPADPTHGDEVTFAVEYDLGNHFSLPVLWLNCYQDGNHVMQAVTGYGWGVYPEGGLPFVLASDFWTEGAADAVATFYGYTADGSRRQEIATYEFSVGA